MELTQILHHYNRFIETSLTDRFFKHENISPLLKKHALVFETTLVGHSTEGRSIEMIKWGEGSTRIFIWSQMHGNEPTGTMALFDLLNFLQQYTQEPKVQNLFKSFTLYMAPMINPDGAERFIRRNANQIDINRDYINTATVEGALLKRLREKINPHFGFNLHDKTTLWSVKNTLEPSTISFLAPASDENYSISETRKNAMLVIADIHKTVSKYIPKNIGLFDESYEPRAFGDNFQKTGTSTILIEAGGLPNDPEKQTIRKYYFLSILSGLYSIAETTYLQQNIDAYYAISQNAQQLYHIIIYDVQVNGITTNISINYDEPTLNNLNKWVIHDIGNTTGFNSYTKFENGPYQIETYVEADKAANFTLLKDNETILSFKNGILVDSTIQIN